MKEAYINATILDTEKNKEFIGDIIIEKDRIVEVGPNIHKKKNQKITLIFTIVKIYIYALAYLT